eukprot:COSAG02_NODE_3209_length_7165_cov_31.071752_10_plen_122_part_00
MTELRQQQTQLCASVSMQWAYALRWGAARGAISGHAAEVALVISRRPRTRGRVYPDPTYTIELEHYVPAVSMRLQQCPPEGESICKGVHLLPYKLLVPNCHSIKFVTQAPYARCHANKIRA